MSIWRRVDRDTIENAIDSVGWQIRVVGENASAKPTRWGVYRIVGTLVWEVRGKVSTHSKLRKMNPEGAHVTFGTLRDAKRFVEHKSREIP